MSSLGLSVIPVLIEKDITYYNQRLCLKQALKMINNAEI